MRYAWSALFLSLVMISGVMAQPRLVIEGNRFDFGSLPQRSTAVQYFWFRSIGSDTVKITKVETGCDCTTMPIDRSVLPPGDSMLVGVTWETGASIGSTGKYPRIHIDGQQEPERIYLTADVVLFPDSLRPISMKPYRAELTKMKGRSVDSMRIVLTNHSELPVGLQLISLTTPEYEMVMPDSLPAGGSAAIDIVVTPEYRDKEFARSLTIAFNGGQTSVVGHMTVPIRRKIIN